MAKKKVQRGVISAKEARRRAKVAHRRSNFRAAKKGNVAAAEKFRTESVVKIPFWKKLI